MANKHVSYTYTAQIHGTSECWELHTPFIITNVSLLLINLQITCFIYIYMKWLLIREEFLLINQEGKGIIGRMTQLWANASALHVVCMSVAKVRFSEQTSSECIVLGQLGQSKCLSLLNKCIPVQTKNKQHQSDQFWRCLHPYGSNILRALSLNTGKAISFVEIT